ncbi:MAG: hypothetical protein JSV35_01935 [Candidatus Bathyarchaeota archaeon]|nr:MAG: hypothetical protein JSV35_01935 [Candidatus Bathyarchaeota archaeon]
MRFPAAAAALSFASWILLIIVSLFVDLENKGFVSLMASYLFVASIVLTLAALLERKLREIGEPRSD